MDKHNFGRPPPRPARLMPRPARPVNPVPLPAVCNPGFGYRYSAHYCSKCPKGQLHCNDEYMLDARGAMGEQWRAGMQTATSNWLG